MIWYNEIKYYYIYMSIKLSDEFIVKKVTILDSI